MKKRNQLVSALLAGLIVGGMAGTTVWADTNDQVDAAQVSEVETTATDEAAAKTSEEPEVASSESSDVVDGTSAENIDPEAPAAEVSSVEEEAASAAETSSQAPAVDTASAAQTDTAAADTVPATEAATTPAAAADTAATTDSENVDGEDTSASVVSDVNDIDGKDATASVTTDSNNIDGQNPSNPEAPKSSSEVTPGTSETGNTASGNQTNTVSDDNKKKETPSTANSAENEVTSGSSSYAGSATGFSYVLTDAQKRQNLTLGFTQVAKKYAVVNIPVGGWLNIREEASLASREVGKINNGGLVYILSEEDGKWYYVESGDVRGFVSAEFLKTGTEAIRAVSARGGETKMETASLLVDTLENKAYRYKLTTVKKVTGYGYTADRAAMIQYAMQFLGRPYVWGGEDLWNGCDCSGYVRGIYAHFGISLPRCSYEQCYTGTRIDPKDARPGDLLFYARDGVVYHVLMYIGNGQAINAQSSATGIVISPVNYDKVCWATTYINDTAATGDTEKSSTQAATLVALGQKASDGDTDAQQQIISYLGRAAVQQWNEYGFLPSVQIAQVIQESGWLSFSGAANGGIQPQDNNVLGMNAELLNDQWISPWQGTIADRNVPQSVNGQTVYDVEAMRTYPDIESCLNDEAAFKIGIHPDLKWVKDVDKVVDVGLEGYATDPTYKQSIKNIIAKYNLTQYDVDPKPSTGSALSKADVSSYTAEQMQLIWAIVAQEDDASYEGALAVITSAMNRADQNYGGYGTNALAQLTADGQYCYSPKVSNPIYWQRRLGGNVPDFVVQAVSDCLTNGVRSHNYLNFRSTNSTGTSVQIGANWYF